MRMGPAVLAEEEEGDPSVTPRLALSGLEMQIWQLLASGRGQGFRPQAQREAH